LIAAEPSRSRVGCCFHVAVGTMADGLCERIVAVVHNQLVRLD
jgi:hypothetical protein